MNAASRQRLIRIVAGVAITVFWLVMMFTLVRDRILPERREKALSSQTVDPATLVANWKDYRENMVVRYESPLSHQWIRIGAAMTSVTQTGYGFRAEFRFGVGLQILGMPRNVAISAAADLDSAFNLNSFVIQTGLAGMDFTLAGLATEELLYTQLAQGGEIRRSKFSLDRRISFLEAVRPAATRQFQVKPGNSISIPVVDPVWSMQRGVLEVRVRDAEEINVGGQKVRAYKVESRLNDFVSTSWVDDQGNTLKRQLAGGLTLERASEGQVRASAELDRNPMVIPRLDPKDFANIPAQPLSSLAEKRDTPLSVIRSITRP